MLRALSLKLMAIGYWMSTNLCAFCTICFISVLFKNLQRTSVYQRHLRAMAANDNHLILFLKVMILPVSVNLPSNSSFNSKSLR
jgi:hypothetical protein